MQKNEFIHQWQILAVNAEKYKTPVFSGFASYLLRTLFVPSSVVFAWVAQ
jgi:hypothetical protein